MKGLLVTESPLCDARPLVRPCITRPYKHVTFAETAIVQALRVNALGALEVARAASDMSPSHAAKSLASSAEISAA
jgi:hypothetical protein